MKLAPQICSIVLSLICISNTLATEVLYEQNAMQVTGNTGTGISSNKVNVIVEQSQAWDNFTLTEPVEITGLEWTGQFNKGFDPDMSLRGENDFLVQFMPDLGNSPDVSSLISDSLLDSGLQGINDGTDVVEMLIPDQVQANGGAVMRYSADITPFTLEPGTYWLSIQAQMTFLSNIDPEWSWVLSPDGDDRIYSYDEAFDPIGTQPGIVVNRDTTFALIGNSLTPSILGDFDENGFLEAADIDILAAAIRDGSMDSKYDLNADNMVDDADHLFWVESIKGTFLGDATLNGAVEFNDFLELSRHFGEVGGWAKGNFDLTTDVQFADFLALSRNFGKMSDSVAAAAVPEPASAGLLGLAAAMMLTLRRKQR